MSSGGTYRPGQGVRFSAACAVLGVPTDPLSIGLTITGPGGELISDPAPVHDDVGMYHSDIVLPDDARPGQWVVVWKSTGTAARVGTVEYPIFISAAAA